MSFYNILKYVEGSFNQGYPKYGETAGRQCVCNFIISVLWSKIRHVSLWRTSDLDYVLNNGDTLCKSLGIDRYLDIDDIPQQLHLEGFPVIIRKVCVYQNETFRTVPHFLSQLQLLISSECNGAIFIITDSAIAIIFHAGFYYICDSHSRDSNGRLAPDGLSILMKFRSISLVEK